ncbi:MAG TPA: ABC transporter ATP-binding protein [Gemmatimonadales bacterium]|nr:ABC transporter ATP-binding protein [Gemmatimonadales bacterium]
MPTPTSQADQPKQPKLARLLAVLPDVWALVWPRRKLLAVGFVLMAINRVSGLVLPTSTKFVIDDVIGQKQIQLLVPLVLLVTAATAIQATTSFALTQLLSKAAQRLIAEMRETVQRHVIRLRIAFFDATKSGALVSRIMTDVEGIRNLIGTGMVELAGGLLSATLVLVLMFRISSIMTGVAAVLLAVFVVALYFAFGTLRPIFRQRSVLNAEVTGRLAETLGGIRVVKGYHREDEETTVFAGGVRRLLDNILKTLTAMAFMGLSGSVLTGLVGATVMLIGARQVVAGTMTVGNLTTYVIYMGFLIAPIIQIVSVGTQLTEALAGLERTRELLTERREDDDPARTVVPADLRGHVEFERVSFEYEAGTPVLKSVSFTALPGTVTALVGPSGAGKSTMIGLVAAFHTPTLGRVVVDGIDLSTMDLAAFRGRLGVVLQDNFLFDGTIRDNVAFSKPDATVAEVQEACRIARVDEFVARFEHKYQTVVGERGVKLSGGQRQRVAIARAILADPRILILDEATSSLDSESEAYIQEGLTHLMRGRTTFVIAHRLSTIRRADQILVLEDGAIVERGRHEELYAASGRYYDMYTKQYGVERNLFLAPGEGDKVPEPEEGAEPRVGGPPAAPWLPRV